MSSPAGLNVMSDFLRDYAGKSVYYWPNVGNAGDSLIAAGTYQLFRRVGLQPIMLTDETDVSDGVVIVGGGGNLVPLYQEARMTVERVIGHSRQLIILPHTIRGNEALLEAMPRNAIIFCRDPESYSHVICRTRASVFLDHDMAFHLRVDDFDDWCKRYPDAPHLFEKQLSQVHNAIDSRTGEGRFFRTDGERKTAAPTLAGSCDLSTMFEFGTWPDNAEKSVYCVVQAIRRAHTVTTDRLHIGVASGLVGKATVLLDNSYGKNRTVYLHSIRRFCPSVAFQE